VDRLIILKGVNQNISHNSGLTQVNHIHHVHSDL